MVLEYGFRQKWKAYLATLAPDTPKTVAEWVRIYRTEGPSWPFPPAPGGVNAIEVLQSSLDHSKEDPQFRHLVQEILPERNVSTTLIHPGSAFRLGSSALRLVD